MSLDRGGWLAVRLADGLHVRYFETALGRSRRGGATFSQDDFLAGLSAGAHDFTLDLDLMRSSYAVGLSLIV